MAIGVNASAGFLQGYSRSWQLGWRSALMLSALLGALQSPVQANETETRHAMAAMADFAECKIMHAGLQPRQSPEHPEHLDQKQRIGTTS